MKNSAKRGRPITVDNPTNLTIRAGRDRVKELHKVAELWPLVYGKAMGKGMGSLSMEKPTLSQVIRVMLERGVAEFKTDAELEGVAWEAPTEFDIDE